MDSVEPLETERFEGSEIAIIGMACRFPGANSPEAFWRNLREGVESITALADGELEPSHVDPAALNDPNYVKAAAMLEDIDLFDAAFFGYTPKEAEVIDPQQRLFLECAWEALERAGCDTERYNGLIGVYAGARTNTYLLNLYSNRDIVRAFGAFQIGLGNDLAFLTTRLSYKLDLKGPSYSVHTACSTSLVAVHLACQGLLTDECRIALAGGVAVNIPQKTGYLYQPGGIVSPDGHCRAFDADAQGTIFGSGVGVVVLKRLEDALADGDHIHAIIRGSALNNDGSLKASFTSPSVYSQAEVIMEALVSAGVDAETIGYIETHGTATPLGDPIEVRALTKAFRASTRATGFCPIGSVKTNVGHLDAAAGIASLIKTALALENKQIPPSLHYERPNPQIDFASSPFYVNAQLADWQANGSPRRAGVSSFGIGGTNAHVVLEEAPPLPDSEEARPWQLLILSARTQSALERQTANLLDHLTQHPSLNLADVAYTLQVGRRAFNYRRALVCRDRDDALSALQTLDSQRVFTAYQESSNPPVVFMFPGGGAQYVDMARDLYDEQPLFREQLDHCAELLKPRLGIDVREVLYPHDRPPTTDHRPPIGSGSPAHPLTRSPAHGEQGLTRTSLALPALFAVEYALAKLWMAWGLTPSALIGHSLGEYVAACLAGVFSLEDALALVVLRGQLFEQLPQGAMLSVPLPQSELAPLLDARLSLAAINSPSQCVVSGPIEAIEQLAGALTEREVEFRRLQIDVAAHSRMVEPILERFGALVGRLTLKPPVIPFVSNVSGDWISDEEATEPSYWVRHLRETVRFGAGMARLLTELRPLLLEVGPGQTLATLAKLQGEAGLAQAIVTTVRHPYDRQSDQAFLLAALGKLWLGGCTIDWAALYKHERRRRLVLPTYPFERQRFWIAPQTTAGLISARDDVGKNPDIAEWFYVPSWAYVPLPEPARPAGQADPQHWLVLLDSCGLGDQLVRRLRLAGHQVTTVQAAGQFRPIGDGAYTIDPQSRDSYASLLAELRAAERLPATIVHLWSLSPEQVVPAARFEQAQDLGYHSLMLLAQALGQAAPAHPLQIEVVANQLHEVGGEGMIAPEKATLLGPCKVIPQEYPNIRCRCIDIVLPQAGTRQEGRLVDQLLAECNTPVPDLVIAYRGARRWVQRFEALRLEEQTAPIRPLRERGVYLITGGLGGIGLILAEYLARTVRARLVLAGRTALPEREAWDAWLATHAEQDPASRRIRRIRAVEDLGGEVLVAAADSTSGDQMRSLIAQIDERFGELNGVIHAAGITSGASVFTPIAEIGAEESRIQFQPKAYGLYVLEEVLRGRQLDFCVLFSSNAAVLGGLGFVAYAAANAFMDAFAASRNATSQMPWISANWDHWPEETRRYVGFQTSMDQYTMTLSESVAAFGRVVSMAPEGQVVVSTGNLPARLGLWVNRAYTPGAAQANGEPHAAHPRPDIQNAYIAPSTAIEQTIADIWQQVMGIERVGVSDNFFELGGHSLLATQIIAQLRQAFQVELPLQRFFETPTVAGLAAGVEAAGGAGESDLAKIARALSQVEQLSTEEIEQALAQRGRDGQAGWHG